jgi:hypothetical protein
MVNWLKEYKLYILVGKGESESYRLTPGKIYMVGRHSTNDIIIFDKNVSRNHFTIQAKEGGYFIMDLGSKNGTFVEGKELSPGIESEVKEGVPIVIGMTILGLGEDYRSYLKTFLDSAGFSAEVNEYGMFIKPLRVKDSNIMEDGDEKVTESLQLMNIRSAMCVPIKSLYSLKGVIYVDSLSRPKGFRKNDLALLQDISGRAALAMDNISLKMPNSLEDRGDVLRSLNNSNTRH